MSETEREGISTLIRRISPHGLGVLTVPTWDGESVSGGR